MKKEVINIRLSENLVVENESEIIEYISQIEGLNQTEWLISIYNNFKSNKNIKNVKRIVSKAREKLIELGVELDEKGNFNSQEVLVDVDAFQEDIETNDKVVNIQEDIEQENKMVTSTPSALDKVVVLESGWLETFNKIYSKLTMGESITQMEVTMLFCSIKTMLIKLPSLTTDDLEYVYLSDFFKGYSQQYYNEEGTLNPFIREAYEKFLELEPLVKKNTPVGKKRILIDSAGVASIVILLELSLIGLITLMFVS